MRTAAVIIRIVSMMIGQGRRRRPTEQSSCKEGLFHIITVVSVIPPAVPVASQVENSQAGRMRTHAAQQRRLGCCYVIVVDIAGAGTTTNELRSFAPGALFFCGKPPAVVQCEPTREKNDGAC